MRRLPRVRMIAGLWVAGLALVACASPQAGSAATGASVPPTPSKATAPADVDSDSKGPVELPQIQASPKEDGPSALDLPTPEGLPTPLIPPEDLMSGGPPPDGIPALDAPRFVKATAVTTLTDSEPVLALSVDGLTRAYPARILIWHEIVNDTIGDTPVAVTYCPLCNSALAFDRRVGERVLSFGTSGMLYKSDLVMYDRQTESLWPQLEGRAVIGRLTGTVLERLPIQTVAWADFKSAHPDAWVLSEDTGYDRAYGTNPYVGYDEETSRPFAFLGQVPDALPVKARVVGLGSGTDAVAVPFARLQADEVLDLTFQGERVVLLFDPALTSALDAQNLSESRTVGATGAFTPSWQGQELTFSRAPGGFSDAETSSTWDILGRAVAGPLAGAQLAPVDHVDTFWFAWSAFQPDTTVLK